MNMDAAVLTDVGEMEVQTRDRPEPDPGDVVVQVAACGVCMTDYHVYHGALGANTPVVLGHESSGEVVAVGDDVDGFAAGDRVAINPVLPCNACSACKRGDTHLCENNTSVGGAGEKIIDGAFAEYVRVPASNVERIGDVPYEYAALAEPLACCVHGADRANVTQGDSVALVGAGPIGLMLLQTLRNRGVAPIAVSELDEDRRDLAKKFGADLVVDPAEEDPVETIREEIGPVEASIEVVGKVATIEQAHAMTADGGTTLIFGVPDQDATMEVSPFDIYFNEIDIHGTYALTRESFERAVTLLRTERIDAASLITERIGLDDIPSAFDRMERAEGLKKMVVPGQEES
ncbi:zinc-dependent alcohol dehydrogenase family protein [Halorubellus sp. PRR65]|uniref:zinc-dependent alcohol dehydrogenase family protein n=1 Tax=Halorubellus sp. PRR65 TaxID=3098148 RepID=UPI002B25E9D8|nr:zinc-dependent alcohol dehydrogenase family protein [Halorubellus sp. PRR65]